MLLIIDEVVLVATGRIKLLVVLFLLLFKLLIGDENDNGDTEFGEEGGLENGDVVGEGERGEERERGGEGGDEGGEKETETRW